MPLAAPTTAEQVMAAIEAVVANGATAEADMVAAFLDSTPVRATAALDMAVELGLLTKHANTYKATNPLCRYTLNADQKAAVLRVALEAYQPFNKFRERLVSTADVSVAAKQTKTLCGLTADRDEVRDTLLSLGTYGHALVTEGAGNYQLEVGSLANHLQVLAAACTELMAAEGRIRAQLGPAAEQVLRDQRDNVIVPLANALVKANNRDGPGAVQQAGNAVEAHIDALAVRKVVVLTGDPELAPLGIEPQQMPDHLGVHLDARVHLLPQGQHHGLFATDALHAQTDGARVLDPPEPRQELVEFRVGRPPPCGPAAEPILDAVERVHRQPQRQVDGIPCLDQAQNRRGGNWRHQGAGKPLAHQRRVGDGRSIGELALRAQPDAAVGNPRHHAAGAEDVPCRRERALHRVAADDLPHVQEHRGVAVAELHQVQQHLALPGLGHGRGIVEPVPGHRGGPDARTSHQQQDRHQDCARNRDRAWQHSDPSPSPDRVMSRRVYTSVHVSLPLRSLAPPAVNCGVIVRRPVHLRGSISFIRAAESSFRCQRITDPPSVAMQYASPRPLRARPLPAAARRSGCPPLPAPDGV